MEVPLGHSLALLSWFVRGMAVPFLLLIQAQGVLTEETGWAAAVGPPLRGAHRNCRDPT